jgi:hypothetical protein
MTEKLLKVALNTINQTNLYLFLVEEMGIPGKGN